MVWLFIQILLVGWVPGAVLLRLPGRSRDYRAALAADERIFWTLLLSAVWSTTIAVLLAGIDRYSFDRLLAINGAFALVVVAAMRQHLALPRPVSRLTLAALVPAAVVGCGLWLYFPPSEYIIGGRDPGAYISEGIQIAQRGQTVIRDPVIAELPEPFRDLFFPSHGQDTYYGLRFMGFFIRDPGAGTVVGQFPHFYPASVAIGYGLNGLSGARQTIGVWAIIGLLAVYFTGVRLFGRPAAGAAVFLLAINVVMVWFGRYPNSELALQALTFAALLAASHGRAGGRTWFAVTAGALLGVALFLRYEILLVMMAFAAAAVLAPITRQRLGLGFLIALSLSMFAGSWYLLDTMRAYISYPVSFVDARGGWLLVSGLAIAALGTHRLLRIERVATLAGRWLPVALAIALAVLAGYAWFLRDEGGRTALGDAMAFRAFGWYVSPWGVALAVAGAAFFVARDLWKDPTFYLTFVTCSTFFFYKTRIVPEHFWTSRRFLGVALPGAMLLMAAIAYEAVAPSRLSRWFGRDRARTTPPGWLTVPSTVLMAALLAPIGLAFWTASAPVARHIQYAGLIPQLERLSAEVGDDDLLLVEARNAGTDLHVLAMPLAYIYARNVLVLESAVPDRATFELFVTWAETAFDRVLFLGGGGSDLLTRRMHASPVTSTTFQVPEYDAPINAYPRTVNPRKFTYGLYALTTGESVNPGPLDLPIGDDDLHVLRFHGRERNDTVGTFRWTGAQSFVVLMGLSPTAREVTLWMSNGGRPDSVPPATVEVALDDEVIDRVTVGDGIAPYVMALPPSLVERVAAAQDPVRLRLRVPTWNPGDALGLPDTRELGVMVNRVQVR